jgi:hypothetical protein
VTIWQPILLIGTIHEHGIIPRLTSNSCLDATQ